MKKVLTKVGYMAFGSLLTLIGYHFGDIDNNSVNAQQPSERVVNIVDKIRVRQLEIVGNDNSPRIYLGTDLDKGQIKFVGDDDTPHISLRTTSQGGQINVHDSSGKTKLDLRIKEGGPGTIDLFNRHEKPVVTLDTTDEIAGITVRARQESKAYVFLGVVHGNGIVHATDTTSESMVTLSFSNDKGYVQVKDKENIHAVLRSDSMAIWNGISDKPVVRAGVTDEGEGYLATFKKDGTLKNSMGVSGTSTYKYRRTERKSYSIDPIYPK